MALNYILVVFMAGIVGMFIAPVYANSKTSSELQCKDIFLNFPTDLAIKNLAKLYLKLEQEKVLGSTSLTLTALKYDYEMKERQIIDHIKTSGSLSVGDFKSKIKFEIEKLQIENKIGVIDQQEIKDKENKGFVEFLNSTKLAKKIIFYPILPGKFERYAYKKLIVEMTKPFHMMSTKVTQIMWANIRAASGENELEKINPSYFKTGPKSIQVNINGMEIFMNPNHPVERVSWYDVMEFIEGLNRLSISNDPKVQLMLTNIMPGHKKGYIYDLPSEAQLEFVMNNRGHATKNFFDRDDEYQISNYAWFRDNSGDETHEVGTKQARFILGQPFYDLEGNVMEWTKDTTSGMSPALGGKDPLGTNGSSRSVLGSSFEKVAYYLSTGYRSVEFPAEKSIRLGFRLIRVKP